MLFEAERDWEDLHRADVLVYNHAGPEGSGRHVELGVLMERAWDHQATSKSAIEIYALESAGRLFVSLPLVTICADFAEVLERIGDAS